MANNAGLQKSDILLILRFPQSWKREKLVGLINMMNIMYLGLNTNADLLIIIFVMANNQ